MHSERSIETTGGSRYRLLFRIASGGMGSVYLATQHGAAGFRRVVAIKRAFPHLLEDTDIRRLMASEIRLSSLVRHPNVVAISDVDDADGELSLIMEYIEGASLAELMRHGLPQALGMRVILDAAEGLQAVHDCTDENGQPLGLVHRDISPQNILIGVDGVARIADFGIAQARDKTGATVSGLIRGKPSYLAPEYIETSFATPSSDVFALAIVAWEILTQRRLFRGTNDVDTIARVRAANVEPPSRFVPGLPPALDAVILRGLALKPEDRFPTAHAFGEALEGALRDSAHLSRRGVVAEFVRKTVGPTLTERRSLVQQATAVVAPSPVSPPSPQRPPSPRSSEADIPVVLPVSTDAAVPSTRILAVAPPQISSRVGVVFTLLAGLTLAIGAVAGTFSATSAAHHTRTARTAAVEATELDRLAPGAPPTARIDKRLSAESRTATPAPTTTDDHAPPDEVILNVPVNQPVSKLQAARRPNPSTSDAPAPAPPRWLDPRPRDPGTSLLHAPPTKAPTNPYAR